MAMSDRPAQVRLPDLVEITRRFGVPLEQKVLWLLTITLVCVSDHINWLTEK